MNNVDIIIRQIELDKIRALRQFVESADPFLFHNMVEKMDEEELLRTALTLIKDELSQR